LDLFGGAVYDTVLVMVCVGADEECDFVHGLVSYDAVSEGTHFVRPWLATDVLSAVIVQGHAMVDAV
jgi:hypothetical protein